MFNRFRFDSKEFMQFAIFVVTSMLFWLHRSAFVGIACCLAIGVLFYLRSSSIKTAIVGIVAWIVGILAVSFLPYIVGGCVVGYFLFTLFVRKI